MMSHPVPGSKYYLPAETKRKKEIERRLTGTFETWGYDEVIPPTLVFAGFSSAAENAGLDEKAYRLVDRQGNLLTLRADLTIPVAHLAASLLDTQSPLRLYYLGNVFRAEEPGTGRQEEFFQAGVELIGAGGVAADLELTVLAVEALKNTGLDSFRVGIGDVSVVEGLLDGAGADPRAKDRARAALSSRNYVEYRQTVQPLSPASPVQELLLDIPSMQGGSEILRRISSAVHLGVEVRKSLADLSEVYRALCDHGLEDHVYLDLSIMRGFRYYTGLVLEGYVPGLGHPVVGGGRYDRLLSQFGKDAPAAGFAVNVDLLLTVPQSQARADLS